MTIRLLYRALERAMEDEDTAARSVALAAHYRGGKVPGYHLEMYRRAMDRRERLSAALNRRARSMV